MEYLKLLTFVLITHTVSANLSRIYSNVTCSNHEECHKIMGNRTNCIYDMCQCIVRHHISDLNTCIEDRGLHERCDANDQCYWGPEMIDKIECNDGMCSCKENYLEASGKICIRFFIENASSQLNYSVVSIMLGILLCLFKSYNKLLI